jgi:hypothetical protein
MANEARLTDYLPNREGHTLLTIEQLDSDGEKVQAVLY